MLYRMNDLCGVEVKTLDGTKIKVTDFLIDESEQKVQFLQIDNGGLFYDDPVLIPRKFLGAADEEEAVVTVDLEKRDLNLCPEPNDFLSVSSLYKQEVERHRNLNTASRRAFFGNVVPVGISVPTPSGMIVDENKLDSNLRSFNEIKGYQLSATDGKCGVVSDVLVDDSSWNVQYYVARTSSWNPFATDMMIPEQYISDIRCAQEKINALLPTSQLKNKFRTA